MGWDEFKHDNYQAPFQADAELSNIQTTFMEADNRTKQYPGRQKF